MEEKSEEVKVEDSSILLEIQNDIVKEVIDTSVSKDVGIAFDGHRSLVADYDSDSSSDSEGTIDSEPDSSIDSSGSIESGEEENDVVVEKLIKPVEEITITVSKDEAQLMGTIKYIVEDQVIVQPRVDLAALDLATILFLDEGSRALGKIEDVIGPITEPIYCVNFSSAKDIESKQIKTGMNVYYAPKTDHTAYVPLPTLLKQKGSDASWEHNEEVPDEFKDFSDDEEEAKLNHNNKNGETSQQRLNRPQRRNQRTWAERRGGGGNNRGNFQRNMPSHPPPNVYHQQMRPPFPPRFPPANYNMPPGYFYPQVHHQPPPPPPSQNSPFPPHHRPDFSTPPPPHRMPFYYSPNR